MKTYDNHVDLIKDLKEAISIEADVTLRCNMDLYALDRYHDRDQWGYNFWRIKLRQVEYIKGDGIYIISGEGILSRNKVSLTDFGFIPNNTNNFYYFLTINNLIQALSHFQKSELSFVIDKITERYENLYKEIQHTAEKYWLNENQ